MAEVMLSLSIKTKGLLCTTLIYMFFSDQENVCKSDAEGYGNTGYGVSSPGIQS